MDPKGKKFEPSWLDAILFFISIQVMLLMCWKHCCAGTGSGTTPFYHQRTRRQRVRATHADEADEDPVNTT